mgnify:FL=1|jgi:hypothetical protein|tara:strand:+ start:109 stop:519 length:411 start_codon:yes stop_codon:yes gene_type:complete
MRLLSLLIILIISLVTTSVQSIETKQYLYGGVIIMSCNNPKSAHKIAAADKISKSLAVTALREEILAHRCGYHKPPVLVTLESKLIDYKDYEGNPASIWKISNINMWSLFTNANLLKTLIAPSLQKEKKPSPGLSI